ncbi:hypothetical protein C9397_10110 [Xanthomonas vasicola pv. vasculorum]|uniref:Uncharacterized protein n=1 Tax=Xanthomonas vasicola TaxID=56459 RepID=A0ABD7SF20_XANVA|nr:hypothetical protein CXP37_20585 [Xanthomonas vasicola pv. vasculorum]PPV04410.1 hypothetical protein XvhCFBP2543_00525 [Xanthomonas vasicola]OWF56984.1 hypothetical protein B1H32_22190 [Xanthomonas vasicola pv. vasculorum]RNK39309.1 hypothetical protein C9401_20500 [Xanthomonas vasicola pv. vasculorum]RNK47751.1 hypothetical protein C9395_02340 [Xanthomonas vasicola pv. vasculorum]
MNTQIQTSNAFAIRSFLTLTGGVVLLQVGNLIGKGSSYQLNWYYLALCVLYALVPIAILRAIQRHPSFSRRGYSIILSTLALLAVAGGIALSLVPLPGP